MKPQNLKTKIFLDSGDPKETKQALEFLGFLDGQTTNPSLIAKNPDAQGRLATGNKFSKSEVDEFYKSVVQEISSLIPDGSVSIEVYADKDTTAGDMLTEARDKWVWIPNAHIKYPTTKAGLEAAEQSIKEGMRVNMTLVFSQEQAASVYTATLGAKKGDVFLSPFIGRLDDRGENGMDFIKNTIEMYKSGDGHVEVLVASVRSMDHFYASLSLGADIITAPLKILKEWAEAGMNVPDLDFVYNPGTLKPIEYQVVDLNSAWGKYDFTHALTDTGIEKFALDWNNLVDPSK